VTLKLPLISMHESAEKVCNSLDELATAVVNAWSDNRTLTEAFGWNHAALTRHDLAGLARNIAVRIREAAPDNIDKDLETVLNDVPKKLKVIQVSTIPYLFNGHGVNAVPAYCATIEWLNTILQPLLGWQTVKDVKVMPAHIARRLRSIQAQLTDLVPEKDALQAQIQLIQEATAAAESLPTDLQSLKEARKKVNRIATESTESCRQIGVHLQEATDAAKNIAEKENEAAKLVDQCEEAYRITTTKGLAAAFDQRASKLANSLWAWVGGLLAALVVGALIGSHRFELLSTVLNSNAPQWSVIWMHVVLSVLSIGAPLWFAWLATKQIGQRFRLSEDYAFKASVAKAYEGYRREAARIDEAFEARLFSSALSRLEEAPLRLVEQESHGSPWQELISSKEFQIALSSVPELRVKFLNIAKDSFGQAKRKIPIIKASQSSTSEENLTED
jgi:hypothetical protein